MKRFIFVFAVVILMFAACSDSPTGADKVKVTATIKNTSLTLEVWVYNGGTQLGKVAAGETKEFEIDKDTCLDLKKYNFGFYDSTVSECFSESKTFTIY